MNKTKKAWKPALKVGNRVMLSPSYLTNGHFLVKREALPEKIAEMSKDAFTLLNELNLPPLDVVERDDQMLGSVVSGYHGVAWKVTKATVDGAIVLIPDATGSSAEGLKGLDVEYADLLGIEPDDVIYSDTAGEKFYDDHTEFTWVLMARRVDFENILRPVVENFKPKKGKS